MKRNNFGYSYVHYVVSVDKCLNHLTFWLTPFSELVRVDYIENIAYRE